MKQRSELGSLCLRLRERKMVMMDLNSKSGSANHSPDIHGRKMLPLHDAGSTYFAVSACSDIF